MPIAPCVLAVVQEPSRFAGSAAALKEAGIEVDCAQGFLDGVLHQVHSAAPVIICDADCVHWKTALAWFNALGGKPAVIFLSRSPSDALWSEMLSGGAFDLVPKNGDPQEMSRAVCAALGRHGVRERALVA